VSAGFRKSVPSLLPIAQALEDLSHQTQAHREVRPVDGVSPGEGAVDKHRLARLLQRLVPPFEVIQFVAEVVEAVGQARVEGPAISFRESATNHDNLPCDVERLFASPERAHELTVIVQAHQEIR
jgi:hypothetical protein